MIVSDVKIRVRATFGDQSSVQVQDADILRWINDGQREVVMMNNELLEKIATANTVQGQQTYAIPTDCYTIRSILYRSGASTSYFKLLGQSLQEFDEYIDGWDGTIYGQSDPAIYTAFANNFMLFPIPATSLTAGLKLYYYRYPVDMVLDTDILDLPLPYHSAIVEYCLKQAYELDEDWTSVQNKASEFNTAVTGQKVSEKDSKAETYQLITVMRSDEDWF
jgi:hypothetical protein